MSVKLFSKYIAIALVCSWSYGFAHMITMGAMSSLEKCPHAQNSHAVCEAVLDMQTIGKTLQKEILIFLPSVVLLIFFTLSFPKFLPKISKTTENRYPPLLQELFSNGILHPKAP